MQEVLNLSQADHLAGTAGVLQFGLLFWPLMTACGSIITQLSVTYGRSIIGWPRKIEVRVEPNAQGRLEKHSTRGKFDHPSGVGTETISQWQDIWAYCLVGYRRVACPLSPRNYQRKMLLVRQIRVLLGRLSWQSSPRKQKRQSEKSAHRSWQRRARATSPMFRQRARYVFWMMNTFCSLMLPLPAPSPTSGRIRKSLSFV